jgi:hypothetical protein
MCEAAGAICSVDPLTASTCGPHELKLQVGVPELDGDLTRLRQNGNTVQAKQTYSSLPPFSKASVADPTYGFCPDSSPTFIIARNFVRSGFLNELQMGADKT